MRFRNSFLFLFTFLWFLILHTAGMMDLVRRNKTVSRAVTEADREKEEENPS